MLQKMIELHLYSEQIGNWDYETTVLSAGLHDVGKIGISDSILNKPGKLTGEEYLVIQQHVPIGIRIIDYMIEVLGDNIFLAQAKLFTQYHHERWDGKGYSARLSGNDIPLEGRFLAIIDVYDALTSERQYKKPLSHSEACEMINDGSGSQFDPELVNIFNLASGAFTDKADELKELVS